MKKGEVYRRVGPDLFGSVKHGDVVIVEQIVCPTGDNKPWIRVIVPRLGRTVLLPCANAYWEKVDHEPTQEG